jgi:N-acetyl-gamma-glutamyl-phosphate reductase
VIRVGIVGGTGYTGAELLRILVGHPSARLAAITSRSESGTPVASLFPHLRRRIDLDFSEPDPGRLAADCDLVFFATPNGTAMEVVPDLLSRGVRVIDLAADFRLKDAAVWERWYGLPHACPDLLKEAVYGLPEIHREAIAKARLVANPGCYPTAVTLGFVPLLERGLVDSGWLVADVKSGVSGAGRKASVSLLMAEVGESFKAYSVAGHRHQPEIHQNLTALAGEGLRLTFVPHLLPMIRGIQATLYARLREPPGTELQSLFERRYRGETFVDVLPAGSHPDTRTVRGSNHCRMSVAEPRGEGIVVVQVVIDNLVKGAAGQAVQNMNLMFGLDESLGLEQPALLP